ncbi:hypothetical protein AUJ15_00505 [Candidatus Micrarchaeota archaeon CG1_02_55_41]|nr:MAG: hypothetical protein AUJ15_00505 [Candidatus Micrarchaeota archaeon CG1_02_55_41]
MALAGFRDLRFQTNLAGARALTDGAYDFRGISPTTPLSSLNLNWTEEQLPERIRTKHVHRLHPYLGKFVPQLVEVFLRKIEPQKVCDPFCGSGTTLVEANALDIPAVGADISEFNCLLSKVKTAHYNLPKLEKELKSVLAKTDSAVNSSKQFQTQSDYLNCWFGHKALRQLLAYRTLLKDYEYSDAMKVILSRAARSSRLTTHFDLDFPKKPQTTPYYCHKHRRICKPTDDAMAFLSRYTGDTIKRIKEFSKIQTRAPVRVICGDSSSLRFPEFDAIITSPPYFGLIDYHEQHRYAYELLGLNDKADLEIGSAKKGKSKPALQQYLSDISRVFKNARKSLSDDGTVVIVVHDKSELFEELASKSGYYLEAKLSRSVNRRTGMRKTDFLEDVLVWRPA